MIKIGFTLALIGMALFALSVGFGTPSLYPYSFEDTKIEPHFYGDSTRSVKKIEIVGIYFVPRNRAKTPFFSWQEVFSKHLEMLKNFHHKQFRGGSEVTYRFYPEAVIGERDSAAYDMDPTKHDDPYALAIMSEEIKRRIKSREGDLYREGFEPRAGVFQVYLVIYEGIGAAANPDLAIVSRAYLTDKNYENFGSTFLTHEFYHTLGVPDAYTIAYQVFADEQQIPGVGILSGDDIMGRVRVPLQSAFLSRGVLKQMGL